MSGSRAAVLASIALMLALPALAPGVTPAARKGGEFRIKFGGTIGPIDPALVSNPGAAALLEPVCARLMTYPDKPPPHGYRVVPEVAQRHPKVSRDLKTYTFTLRRAFRFSNGQRVTAAAFSRAIHRALAPEMRSPGAQAVADIVGAKEVLEGRARAARGVVARGYRLVIRLVRPVPDFPARMTMPFFCAVPPSLHIDPEGVERFPSAGPYYIAEFVRGRRLVLRRNPHYAGSRPHHVDRFVADIEPASPDEVIARVERGEADWGAVPPRFAFEPRFRLAQKYGVNRPNGRFFIKPGLGLTGYVFNTSRPLFRNNARLRRAVGFALDRRTALPGADVPGAENPTDQLLPPAMPGFRNARIYPLRRPDVRRARALARGNTRSGKAVLFTATTPAAVAAGQSVKQDLRRIGIEVETRAVPPSASAAAFARGEWDLTAVTTLPAYIDPYAYVNVRFDPRFIRTGENLGRFDSPKYTRMMRNAARLQGRARYRAYGKLDVALVRDAAPMIPIGYSNIPTFVSARVDPRCLVLRPGIALTPVCLKR